MAFLELFEEFDVSVFDFCFLVQQYSLIFLATEQTESRSKFCVHHYFRGAMLGISFHLGSWCLQCCHFFTDYLSFLTKNHNSVLHILTKKFISYNIVYENITKSLFSGFSYLSQLHHNFWQQTMPFPVWQSNLLPLTLVFPILVVETLYHSFPT